MSIKDKYINKIINTEGGYVDDPDDSGGETNFGITRDVARKNGYHGPMIDMPREVAHGIYTAKYWDSLRGDDIVKLSGIIAHEIVDAAVHMGVYRAATFLQRSLNVFNNRGALYSDIAVDGDIGPATLTALAYYLDVREENVLMKALNCLQGSFYIELAEPREDEQVLVGADIDDIELAERREKDEKFVYGWLRNRVQHINEEG